MKSQPIGKLHLIIRILVLSVFSFGLINFILIGTTSRYVQDDYCYAHYLRGDNFIKEQLESYTMERPYSGNRFSLTLGAGLSELAGPSGVSIFPGLFLVAWVAGSYLLIKNNQFVNMHLEPSRLEQLILAEALVFFSLSLTQDWVQSYFWRAGMLPYLAPLVTGTYLFVLIQKSSHKGRHYYLWLCSVFLLAVFTGGFSEVGAVVLLTLLVITLGISLIVKKKEVRLPLIIALLGGLLASVLLVIAPMNMDRLKNPAYDNAFQLLPSIWNSLEGVIFFYKATAYRMTLQYLSVLIFFVLIGLFITRSEMKETSHPGRVVLYLFFSLAIGYILTFSSMLPTFLTEASYPKHRILIIPRFFSILLAMFTGYGFSRIFLTTVSVRIQKMVLATIGVLIIASNILWFFGKTQFFLPPPYPEFELYIKSNLIISMAVGVAAILIMAIIVTKLRTLPVLTILIVLYLIQPTFMATRIMVEYPILRERASLWDNRDAQIFSARNNGLSDITVRAFDSFVGLAELSENPGMWVNRCAALYYGIDAINAVEPVLDPVRFENP